ncbi:PREDICTED: uncharacterized protein LOC109235796 [Nicotiana attenuata]|uniref:uncharacterized protein LOC109235796 n=1 Tax=Nicotiana attenuata TaxID=49451 RepID=UPI0009052DD6|nr:PREDICTED: uncharacterized protein LOC109235796 [Nicotiana attenuata]
MQNEQEEPQHAIHMIVGGVDIPKGPVFKHTKVTITRESNSGLLTRRNLVFQRRGRKRDRKPHNDALATSIQMNKIQVKRVLNYSGSSANIIQSSVVEELGIQDQIVPAARVLNGFNMASETTKGAIIIPVNVAGTIQETKFHVVEGDMRYNALLGRPWIHNMTVVPSTFH